MKKAIKLATDLEKKYQLLDKDPDELSHEDVEGFSDESAMDPEDAKRELDWHMPDKWFFTGFVSRFKKLTPEHQDKVLEALIKSRK